MTPSQFSALSLKDQAATLKTFRAVYNENRANAKLAKADALIQKRQAKALKQEQAIVKAQLRLQKLLEKQARPVGTKATKANRKAGTVKVFNPEEIAEANAIAQAITAKKAKASETANA